MINAGYKDIFPSRPILIITYEFVYRILVSLLLRCCYEYEQHSKEHSFDMAWGQYPKTSRPISNLVILIFVSECERWNVHFIGLLSNKLGTRLAYICNWPQTLQTFCLLVRTIAIAEQIDERIRFSQHLHTQSDPLMFNSLPFICHLLNMYQYSKSS